MIRSASTVNAMSSGEVGEQLPEPDAVRAPPLDEEEPDGHRRRDRLAAHRPQARPDDAQVEPEDEQRVEGDLDDHRHHPQHRREQQPP
jgi:hypothetical protein